MKRHTNQVTTSTVKHMKHINIYIHVYVCNIVQHLILLSYVNHPQMLIVLDSLSSLSLSPSVSVCLSWLLPCIWILHFLVFVLVHFFNHPSSSSLLLLLLLPPPPPRLLVRRLRRLLPPHHPTLSLSVVMDCSSVTKLHRQSI